MFDQHEPAEFKIADDLSAVERQLARLTPAAPRIDRDRLMFEAGRAAERAASEPSPNPSLQGRGIRAAAMLRIAGSRHRFWPAATATMTAASVLLSTMLVSQQHALQIALQQNTPPIIATQATAAPPSAAMPHAPRSEMNTSGWSALESPRSGYLGVRYIALTRGIGALDWRFPAPDGGPASPHDVRRTQREMLDELLPATSPDQNPRS